MKSFKSRSFIVVAIGLSLFPVCLTEAEILIVPAYDTPTITSSPLQDGTLYLIEARGTFVYDTFYGAQADAEWATLNPPTSEWVEHIEYPGFEDILDLLVDGSPRDWMGTTDGVNFSPHTYSPSHIYRHEWLGMGNPITFRIGDHPNADTDNSGSLEVEITVVPPLMVDIDIKPRSCPNPLNVKDKGILPVAILGSADFDIFSIDMESIRLETIAPIRIGLEDVAAPVLDGVEFCECTTEGPDGYDDLTLGFNAEEIIAVLGEVIDDEELELTLTGVLNDGRPIQGNGCVVIKSKGNPG